MIDLQMSEEEAKLLLNITETYHSHLEVEIHRTNHREFRDALKVRETGIKAIIEKLKGVVKA